MTGERNATNHPHPAQPALLSLNTIPCGEAKRCEGINFRLDPGDHPGHVPYEPRWAPNRTGVRRSCSERSWTTGDCRRARDLAGSHVDTMDDTEFLSTLRGTDASLAPHAEALVDERDQLRETCRSTCDRCGSVVSLNEITVLHLHRTGAQHSVTFDLCTDCVSMVGRLVVQGLRLADRS